MTNPDSTLRRRQRNESLFRAAGLLATAVGVVFLGVFLASLIARGASAFTQTYIKLDVTLSSELLAPHGEYDSTAADADAVVRNALMTMFPEVTDRSGRRDLVRLVSIGAAYQVRDLVTANPGAIDSTVSTWVPAAASIDMLEKGQVDASLEQNLRRVSKAQLGWVRELREQGRLERRFNSALLTSGDSSEPELAGIRGAVVGSFLMLLVTLALAFPIGVAAAIYLEEFAPRNRWTDIIEVNINNLAAVPSIVFGLLGLAVFINWFGLPRSAPLAGGLVLALMTLPVIIIASRAAITAVPQSIRDGALALGASQMQVVFHHILPQSLPGILTGTIIGMSRALGESAPLLMIGMVAFIVDVPQSVFDPATALPVQIFLWADSPERAFEERTAAAILVLIAFLLVMNLAAIMLRKKMERK